MKCNIFGLCNVSFEHQGKMRMGMQKISVEAEETEILPGLTEQNTLQKTPPTVTFIPS